MGREVSLIGHGRGQPSTMLVGMVNYTLCRVNCNAFL